MRLEDVPVKFETFEVIGAVISNNNQRGKICVGLHEVNWQGTLHTVKSFELVSQVHVLLLPWSAQVGK